MSQIPAAFSARAQTYDQYRWGYAPAAVEQVWRTASLSHHSRIADIASGTGLLTSHFLGRVACVYAVEPAAGMRAIAEQKFSQDASFRSLTGTAESTGLPGQSVDLILVGQAVNYFDPQPALLEFQRISQPGAWLALINNTPTGQALGEATQALFCPENGCNALLQTVPPPVAKDFYFETGWEHFEYSQTILETYPQFLGGLCSSLQAPEPSHPLFPNFERRARQIFDTLSLSGYLQLTLRTDLFLGRLRSA